MMTNMDTITMISLFVGPVCFVVGILTGVSMAIYIQKKSLDAMQKIASGDSITEKEQVGEISDTAGYDENDDEYEYEDEEK